MAQNKHISEIPGNNTANIHERSAIMAKAGMRRPDPGDAHGTESNKKQHFPKNDVQPVPEIQGKAKSGKKKVDE